ncbi:MAG TPA: ferritin-like domain-containing protein [Myxococcota bacterium]|nr:ferritin-like domain-containing protein [Myxococcota bacterium]
MDLVASSAALGAVLSRIPPGLDPSVAKEVLVYSYYRDAELRGANLLFLLLRLLDDPQSQIALSEHLADETRHAWLWTQLIREIGGAPVPIEDGYQVRIGKRAGRPRRAVELLALTVVVEQRALRRYQQHLKRSDVPERTREVLRAVTKDEAWHIDWVRDKARELAARDGVPDVFDELLHKYREIDREVMDEIEDLERELVATAA